MRLERTAERIEPMIPALEELVADHNYRQRRRAEHGRTVKSWQIRLGFAVGIVTLAALLSSSLLTIAHLIGGL